MWAWAWAWQMCKGEGRSDEQGDEFMTQAGCSGAGGERGGDSGRGTMTRVRAEARWIGALPLLGRRWQIGWKLWGFF